MGNGQNSAAAGPPARPSGVPKLNLNEISIKGPTSQNKAIAKNNRNDSTSTPYTTMATPRSQTFSPPSNGSLVSAQQKNAGKADKSKKTPTSTTGVSFATSSVPQRTGSGDGRLSSQSTRTAHDYEQLMMTPRGGSYRDVLATPRGTTRSIAEHIPAPTGQQQRHGVPPQSSRPSSSSSTTTTSQQQQQQQQQRSLKQKVDRASHEQTHVKQQITTLDAAIQAQQAALVENITVVQNLGQRRDRMANDAAALQAAVARAHAASSARQAEIQELEVLITALQATLQSSQEQEEILHTEQHNNHTATATSSTINKKQVLMQLMHAAAGALRLPTVTHALETELQKQQNIQQTNTHPQGMATTATGRTNNNNNNYNHQGTTTSRAATTARSEISTSRYLTPAATMREGGVEDGNEDVESVISSESSSEGEDSMDSARTGTLEKYDLPATTSTTAATATTAAAAVVSTTANAQGTKDGYVPPSSSCSSDKLNRGSGTRNIPLLQLNTGDTIPAHFQQQQQHSQAQSQSARLASPGRFQALARLQSIRSKLEVAEAILTARVPEHGEDETLQN